MVELKHPYPRVRRNGLSYGGSQTWFSERTLHRSGCGLIAGSDLLLYLHRYHSKCRSPLFWEFEGEEPVAFPQYHRLVREVGRKYLFVIPHVGMNGLMLTGGLNRYFRKSRIPLRAHWGAWKGELFDSIGEMLRRDVPVILAVGPNFPWIWQKHKVKFYVKKPDGTYCSTCAVKAHFVTITGMDMRWLQISSWGRQYYISREELTRYVEKHSSYLVSNIAYIKEHKRKLEHA